MGLQHDDRVMTPSTPCHIQPGDDIPWADVMDDVPAEVLLNISPRCDGDDFDAFAEVVREVHEGIADVDGAAAVADGEEGSGSGILLKEVGPERLEFADAFKGGVLAECPEVAVRVDAETKGGTVNAFDIVVGEAAQIGEAGVKLFLCVADAVDEDDFLAGGFFELEGLPGGGVEEAVVEAIAGGALKGLNFLRYPADTEIIPAFEIMFKGNVRDAGFVKAGGEGGIKAEGVVAVCEEAEGISMEEGAVVQIGVEVGAIGKAGGIGREPATEGGIVVTQSKGIKGGMGIDSLAGIAPRAGGAQKGLGFAKGGVAVPFD